MNYILIITENKTVFLSLKVILQEDCFVEESPPESALKVISERRPSLIFLDSQLNETGSAGLMAKLLLRDPSLTVVKLVSSVDINAMRAVESGAFDVVEKPFDAERIKHIAKRAFEREKLQKENEVLKEKADRANVVNNVTEEAGEESFFHDLFRTVAENFPDTEKTGMEVLKALKKRFYFGNMLLFLRNNEIFTPAASLGMGDVFNELKITHDHPLTTWFLSSGRILNLSAEKDVSYECRSFMEVLHCRLAFPIKTLNGRLIGILLAGGKLTGLDTTLGEISFLSVIIDYLSAVFDNSFLYREISFRKDYQDAILRNIPTGIITVDRDGRIVIFNSYAEEISGIKYEELRDKPVEKAGSQIADFMRRALKSGEAFNRIEINYKPGNILLGLSTNPIRDEKGDISGALAIFQNLTFIKEVEKREKEAERNRYWTSLASRLSHELKNPLVAIKAFAQMLPSKYEDGEFRTSFSEVVQSEVRRINEIIEKINKLADSMELKTSRVDIVGLCSGQINEICKDGGVKFNFAGHEKIFVPADAEKIKEAIGYIMDFINEDTAGSGTVNVSFDNKDENLEISIVENGSKINFNSSEDVFIPFNTATRSSVSIGVVLARKILESHGGSFNCMLLPSAKNFVITLPSDKDKDG
ncbi:MAG: PAS domain-containing protein [Candidatus Omnitrophica bacterium]|nr:PAS domain-containing protein [Candidatus Omnitrophota bacterium]